jgi:hypothetical protein
MKTSRYLPEGRAILIANWNKTFGSTGSSGSICASVIKALNKHISTYDKGTGGLFSSLKERLPKAMIHASQLVT